MTSIQNNQEKMQKNCEVPASGLQNNGYRQCNGNPIEAKNDSNFLELDHNELLESSIEPNKKQPTLVHGLCFLLRLKRHMCAS
ncbi:hypothetical protein L1987_03391 [Smallanthus sonchifolius]|uniref:Uncharacterized protein n=1 Tax=Smallanthus sonchifolius TaxID=185202 RepID=A0ACB9KAJ3_9ASTR|nr:hypothetical protein L1987_03391 [Smallanthus sonchifolius]